MNFGFRVMNSEGGPKFCWQFDTQFANSRLETRSASGSSGSGNILVAINLMTLPSSWPCGRHRLGLSRQNTRDVHRERRSEIRGQPL